MRVKILILAIFLMSLINPCFCWTPNDNPDLNNYYNMTNLNFFDAFSMLGNITGTGYSAIFDNFYGYLNASYIQNNQWIEDSQESDLNVNRSDYWDGLNSPTDIPHATPNNGDVTHFSLADEIYDWVIGLGYTTLSHIQSNYYNNTEVYTKTESDTNFVDISGDTMTGDLNMSDNELVDIGNITLSGFTNGSILYISEDGKITQMNSAFFFEPNGTQGKVAIGSTAVMNNVLQVVKDEGTTNIDNIKALIAARNKNSNDGTYTGFTMQTKDSGGNIYSGVRLLTNFTNHSIGNVTGDLIIDTRNAGTRSIKLKLGAEGNLSVLQLTNCDTIDTDAGGMLICGTDSDTTYSHLSNFTDNLGDRGYTSNLNFTNDAGYYNSSDFSIGDYSTTAEIIAFGYYNSSDFVITDYFTKTQIENFGYYNSSDFSISDYYTKAQVLAFNYYNSSDFDIADYVTSAILAGYNYYNASDFSISDYYTKTQIDNFNYYNSTDFNINDYATNVKVDSIGNFSAWDKDYVDLINKPTALSDFNDDLGARGYTHLSNFTDNIGVSSDWDEIGDVPIANVTDGDNTHLVLADDIYDWVFGNPFSWITNSVSDLTNYYLRSEVYNKTETYNKSEVLALNSSWDYTTDTNTNCSVDNSCAGILYETELNSLTELNTQITDATLYDVCSANNARVGTGCSDVLTEGELTSLAELDTQIGITGTASSSTYWRGDNSWNTPTDTNTNCSSDGSCSSIAYDSEINKTYVDAQDSAQDACSEITGCIENAITDGNTNWDNSYGFFDNIANFTGTLTSSKWCLYDGSEIDCNVEPVSDTNTQLSQEQVEDFAGGMVDGVETHITVTYNDTGGNFNYIVTDNWYDSVSDIPTATPNNGDTTHLSTADHIFDYIVSLAYATSAYVDSLGNWSADKSSYWNTSTDLDTVIATDEITELKIDFNTACGAGNHLYVNGNNLACEADDDTTYTAGDGITLTGNQFNHTDTSSQASSNNAGRTYIQDIILDTYGHITSIITATETVTDTDTQDLSYNTATDVISLVDGGSIDITEVDTSADTICSGTTTYLDGERNCDDISLVYEVQLNNEAGLYAVLSDVTNFLETNDAGALTTLNTGQGAYELYAMNQDVESTDGVVFATVNTGQGANELYDMNQNVETTNAVTFTTVNTGQGANELYDMNQNVLTTSNVQFQNITVDTILGETDPTNMTITSNATCWTISAGDTTFSICE